MCEASMASRFLKWSKKMYEDNKTYRVKIRGITPLIMHNGECADPQNRWALEMKPLKDKKKKTELDQKAIRDINFISSLYWSEELGGIYIPTENFRKMILEAGRACDQKGAKKQVVGISFSEYLGYPLDVKNRSNIEALKNDNANRYFKMVIIGRSRVPNIRAIFKEWSVEITISIDGSIVDASTVEEWLNYAGGRVGLGGRRPYAPTPGEFRKFIVEEFKEV